MAEEVAVTNTLARRFKQRIVRRHMVRFHMALILAATTASGLLSSKLLLEAGILSVRMRYPLAVMAASVIFLGLTRLWVGYVLIGRPSKGRSWFNWGADSLDVPAWGGGGGGQASGVSFGGGDSGGGGASSSWEGGATAELAPSTGGGGGGGGNWFPSLNLDIDLDDGIWILVLLAALVAAILGAGAYLVYAAPEILPDAALSALMASSLSRAAKRAQTQGWATSVLRATWIPMAVILLLAAGLGFAVHHSCPAAAKLADVLACPDMVQGAN